MGWDIRYRSATRSLWVPITSPNRRGEPPTTGAPKTRSFQPSCGVQSPLGIDLPVHQEFGPVRRDVRQRGAPLGKVSGTDCPPFSDTWRGSVARLKSSRVPSVSMGAPFPLPSLVIWTVPVIRGGGSGRLSQESGRAETAIPRPPAHFGPSAAVFGDTATAGTQTTMPSPKPDPPRTGTSASRLFSIHRRTMRLSAGGRPWQLRRIVLEDRVHHLDRRAAGKACLPDASRTALPRS